MLPANCLPQNYLRAGGTLAQLEQLYGIKHRRHGLFPNLVQLKYDSITCDFNNALVRQCRGLILDEDDQWRIIARPFDKFGNVGEAYVPEIHWPSANIFEKLDGSLMILYHYDGMWRVATSGMPDAAGDVNGIEGFSFAELFWKVWKNKNYQTPHDHHQNHTFMFELMTPFNRVVIKHPVGDLKLIGIRNRFNGEEMPIHNHVLYDRVKVFTPNTLSGLQESFSLIDPSQMEGYVVCDKMFNRIKVKHPGYVALHRLKDGLVNQKNILEVVRTGETPELISVFPELEMAFTQIRALYEGLIMQLVADWNELEGIAELWRIQGEEREIRKFFAQEAAKTIMPDAMFALLDGRVDSVREYLSKEVHIDRLASVLQVNQIEMMAV
jgi:hypothetical protein